MKEHTTNRGRMWVRAATVLLALIVLEASNANALITENKSFPDGVLILGAPARIVRELTDEELAGLPAYATRYIERAERYRSALRQLA